MNNPFPPRLHLASCLASCLFLLFAVIPARAEPPPLLAAANPESTPTNVEAPAEEAAPPPEDTEIDAVQGATFAAKDRIAVFYGDVRVRDPRFTLACDKLTVFLNKGGASGASAAPTPATTPPPVAPAGKGSEENVDASRSSTIDHAVAEGHVIIIQKRAPTSPGEEEKVSIGRADTVEFDNKTGDMTLRGMPRVEQNGNSHEALSRSTVMILDRENNLRTRGPSRTLIVPHNKDNPGGSKPGTTPPAGSPAARRPQATGT